MFPDINETIRKRERAEKIAKKICICYFGVIALCLLIILVLGIANSNAKTTAYNAAKDYDIAYYQALSRSYTSSSTAYGTDSYSFYGYKPDYIKETKYHYYIEGYKGTRQGSFAEKQALGGDDLFRCLECHHIYPKSELKVWYCKVCYKKLHPNE